MNNEKKLCYILQSEIISTKNSNTTHNGKYQFRIFIH